MSPTRAPIPVLPYVQPWHSYAFSAVISFKELFQRGCWKHTTWKWRTRWRDMKMQDLRTTDQLARRENARHGMKARTLSALLKMQDLKLREFLREPQRNCTRSRDETTVACKTVARVSTIKATRASIKTLRLSGRHFTSLTRTELLSKSSPYYEDMWRRYWCLTSFFPILDTWLIVAKIQPDKRTTNERSLLASEQTWQWQATSRGRGPSKLAAKKDVKNTQ